MSRTGRHILIFLLFALIFSCNSTDPQPPPTPSLPPISAISADSVITDNHILVFYDIPMEEYDKYSISDYFDKVESKYDSIDVDTNIDLFVDEILKEPKFYFEENLYPLIDWNKKLSIFLNAEEVMKTTLRKYGAAHFGLNNEGEDDEYDEGYDSPPFDAYERDFEITWFVLQEFGLFKEKYFSRIDSSTLELQIQSGENLIFKDSQSDTIKYNFVAFFPNINHYLIEKEMFEKHQLYLVNRRSGEEQEVWGVPDFLNKSISKFKLLPIIVDSEIPREFRGIQLFSMNEKSLSLTFEFTMSKWNPKEIVFLNNSTAYIKITESLFTPESDDEYEYLRMEIIKK